MDLNEFIFRDDTAEALGASEDSDFAATEESFGSVTATKIALAIGGAVVGLSHFLGHAGKHL